MIELQQLMNDISQWSNETFGKGQRNPAIVRHLKKEVDELIKSLDETISLGLDDSFGIREFGVQMNKTKMEYADCLMLLLDSAKHFGMSSNELIDITRKKLEINKSREWGEPDGNGVIEHIKGETVMSEWKYIKNGESALTMPVGRDFEVLFDSGLITNFYNKELPFALIIAWRELNQQEGQK